MVNYFPHRIFIQTILASSLSSVMGGFSVIAQPKDSSQKEKENMHLNKTWDKVFPKSNKVDHEKLYLKIDMVFL